MTVRKEVRGGIAHWIVDIPYKTADGRRRRYRRDAQIQGAVAARAEERRLLAELARSGEIVITPVTTQEPERAPEHTFADAVDFFKRTRAISALKTSTRHSYGELLDRVLVPRFEKCRLEDITLVRVMELDAELVSDDLAASTRRNVQVVLRSVLRTAKEAGMLPAMPELPKLPKVGRTVLRSLTRAEVDAILKVSSDSARLAFTLAAFAGLRAGEVRGLTWTDVDVVAKTLVVRRAISHGIAAAPKSGHQRLVPLARPLLALLEPAEKRTHTSSSPVAPTRSGKVWGEWGLRLAFQRVQARAGLSGFRFHDLRHFFVTELFRNGGSAPSVQALAGHADLSTTQRYAHMVASDLRATIARFERGNGVETGP